MTTTYGPAVSAGMRAQAAAREQALAAGTRPLGWKAGFGTAAAIEKLGTTAPLAGFLTDRTLLANGATCSLEGWSRPVLEPELAVRLSADLPAGASWETAAAAIGEVALAFELVDLGPADDVEAILGGNIFHRALLLGAFAPVLGSRPLDGFRLDLIEDGTIRQERVDPSDLLGDLVEVVQRIADQAPLAGGRLGRGDIVITGSAVPGVPIAGGHRFAVRAPGLDPVAVTLS